jgi:F0F1-type ATP synthase membrane subunit b/b'
MYGSGQLSVGTIETMSATTEARIQRLSAEALSATTEDDIDRILEELRPALQKHVTQAKKKLQAQAASFASLA